MSKKILFKSINFIRRGSGANLNLFRYATMVLVLLLGMSESAWGDSHYYSQFTAKSGNTAQGLVYAAGSNSEGGLSSYTNQVTPDKDDGSSGEEYTWYAWAKAARGYRFKTWTKGSNINSNGTLTNAATTFGVKHATSDGSTVSGDATATFEGDTPYTITFKKPENFGGYTAEYANYSISNNAFADYSKTITMTSSSANTNETSYASDKVTLTATARLANFLGWYSGSTLLSDKTAFSFIPSATVTIEGRWEDVATHLNMTFKAVELDDSSNPKGYYTVGGTTVSTADVVVNTGELYYLETTLTATPAEGYVFTGWYTKEGKKRNFISYDNPFNAYFDQETTLYASFSYNNYPDDQKAQFKVGSTNYTDLNAANAAAAGGSNKTIVCTRDGILPPGNYTISNGVKLYIPYSSSESSQTTPAVVTTAAGLSVYRKLVMTEGANITVENGGVISVGGQIMSASGGSPSAYPTGACGMIDMSKGGHIELNNGATLYVWGFIKGQDMDQGNNTLDVGTITANSGSNIWEDFWLADWRGGSACSCLAMNDGHMMFPFQGYTMQNIEVPTLYNYGATLNNYINVYGDKKTNAGTFATIGNENTLFLLKDAKSKVCKWYDPTTDLVCYELTGTTQIDALNVDAGITEVSSAGFNLPITSNMHVILNSDITISKPITILPGAVLEVKSGYTATIGDNLYMYDTDDWGKGVLGYYFYPFSNLTSHKSRGTGSANDLEDAKLVVDGTLTITGKIYSTTGGSNIMGNGGGKVTLPSVLYGSPCLYQAWGGASGTQTATTRTLSYWLANGDTYVEPITVNSANLYNEDGSYTQSAASTTYYNVNGRWFAASAKDEKSNHTYDFTYISSGAVSGAGGTNTTTDAVYSNDKTGMEARMKWFNVTSDCSGEDEEHVMHYWWKDANDYFYNWTMLSTWHQFIPTETEGLYSGSNNKLYTKTDVSTACTWSELGETDVNCLYTIEDTKKALVDGHFIALEPNSDDAAFHEAADPTKYYICFEGCNWHAATKYEGEKKAYVVDETTFIWFEERWMAVEREEPFFYTKDETNVTIYYEYIGSEWVLAQPYVEVTDAIETRQLLRFNEAITVASGKKNATITLLRDLVNITTPMTFTGANTTCTLDLNGHVAELQVKGSGTTAIYMLTLNCAGTTFTITDNTADKKGELKLITSFTTENNTKRWGGIYLQNGALVMANGKLHVENPVPYTKSTKVGYIEAILVASGKTLTVNGGTIEAKSAYNPYGIEAASGTPTININGGTIETIATTNDSPYGIIGYGTINIKGGEVRAIASGSSSSRGVSVSAGSSYQGTVNVTGGTIYAEATGSAQGIYCGGTAVVTGDYNATTPNNTPKNRYYAKANISGGTITAICRTSTKSYGVLSYGTTTISGGTITSTVQKSNQNTAYGVCASGGTTTIQNGANITANAPTIAYGVTVTGANGDSNRGWPHVGVVNITGGTITANTTNTTTAYGLLVTGATWTINKTNDYKVFNGDYAAAGTATVTGGTFNANAKTTLSRGIAVAATKTLNAASATPKCTINGGYYKMTGTGDVLGCNASALPADFHINGGYYSHNGNLATYAVSPKHVLTLAAGDANRPPFYYKVAEAYQVTFKNEDGTANIIDPIYQEVGTAPVCSTEPTKTSTATNSFTFDGWATEANGAKVYEPNGLPNVTSAGATYYAHFATTTLKYRIHLDAATNSGECATENIYVEPGKAVSTAIASLPTATKYGYTFNGWYTASTGGTKLETTTVINADAEYFAQFTANSHTLTWDLAGGTVGTAGKIGSTTWPAKNATGTQSRSVAYGTVLTTIPVVTKTGYVFNRWNPVPTSSMPDNDVTYTALWNPATNTKYYVKHYQQNVNDNNYTLVETDNLTGTTDAIVTPARKSYDGFLSPAPQQLTIGAAGTSELAYNYDRVVYTINWNASANGGTCATASTDVRHGATIALPAATKTGHILEGWYTKAEGGNKITDGSAILQNYGTLYAQFVPTYTIIWNDEDGNELRREEKLMGESLTPPDYSKTNTAEWNYTFHGWNDGTTTYAANAIPAVSGAATYTADVTKVKNNYTLTIGVVEAGYGSVNETSVTVPYGTSVSTSDNVLTIGTTTVTATPTASNAQYTYTFSTWQNVPTSVTDNVDNIQAVFTRTLNTYTVTWKNGDATLETDENVAYGATPHYDGATPTKAADAEYTYTFNGWSPAIGAISGTTVYTATYTSNPTVASVTADGTTYYASVSDAITAANGKTNAVVTMLQNASVTSEVTITASMTINLNGKTISSAVASATGVFKINAHTYTVTINGAGGTISHKANASVYGLNVVAGTLNMTGGTVEVDGGSGNPRGVFVKGSSSKKATVNLTDVSVESKSTGNNSIAVYTYQYTNVTIHSGTYKATANSSSARYAVFARNETGSQITIRGGKFNGADKDVNKGGTTATISISGGYYVHNTGIETYCASNHHVFDLEDESPYLYEVAEGYTLDWTTDGDALIGDYTSGLTKVGTAIIVPNTPTKTGYTFAGWSPEVPSVMPAEDTECVAQWTPNTNTAYTVKHYQQNLDGTYPEDPTDTDNETGTTDTEVTPAVKNYTGFTAPDAQTVTVLPDGSRVVTYQYTRKSYNLTWDANGGELSGTYTSGSVKFGATINVPTATRTNYDFVGWDEEPAATMPAENKTYTAQWSLSAVTILWKSEDGSETLETDNLVLIGAAPSFDGTAPTKATTESYTYTFDGWTTEANGAGTFYAIGELPTVSAAAIYYVHFTATANVASVKVGSTTTYYTTIDAAFAHVNLQTVNTELKLLRNTTAAASLVFTPAAAITCTFDLNNCTLSGELGRLIDVKLAKSTFIITDNSVAKGGKVDNNYNANERVYGVVLTAGTFKLQNGAIYSTNPHKYSSATANKSSAATAVYVAAGQTFTMENGTVESASQYASYAIYMAAGTSTVTIENGLVKGRTTASTTAAGIYNLGKGLTINGGHIIGHAYTTTAYGVYLNGGHATINGGTIEATNDTTSNKGTTTTYGIYVAYKSSTYKGVLTIPSTSSVNVFAKARTTTAAAVTVGGSSTGSTIAGGTFTAKTKTSSTAYGVYSSGNITISGGTFNVIPCTSTGYGIYSLRGKVTISGSPTFNVTTATTTAYGAFAYGTIGKKGTGKYSGTIEINGGTFNVTSTKETAYGAYAGLMKRDLTKCSATNDTVPGMHYMPGIISITNGIFNVKATTTGAYGIVVAAAKSESGTVGTTTRIPLGTITGGKFKVESMGDANATAYAVNTATTAERLVVEGGWYNTDKTNASSNATIGGKYTAPTKNCDYHVLPLTGEDPYKYEVAEAYTITFKNGKETLQSGVAKKESAPAYVGDEPTKAATAEYSYAFDGWSDTEDGAVVNPLPDVSAAATYYAHFSSTPNPYTLTWDVNGGDDLTGDYTYGSTAYGTTIVKPADPTKTGYTFADWTPSVATTMPAANTTYTATWTPNTNTAYTVKHYKEKLEGGYNAEPDETDNLTGTTDAATAAVAKSYTGFTAKQFAQGTIAGDGSTVVNIYYDRITYTITWKDGDGNTIETDANVKYGATPEYNGTTPTKTATPHYTYTFDGWSETEGGVKLASLPVVSKDATYFAHYASTVNNYTVSIAANNAEWGTVSSASVADVPYGTGITKSGNTLTIGSAIITATSAAQTAEYTYTFDHWDNVPETVTGNVANIQAVFTRTLRSYTVIWDNYGGVELERDENVPYGTTPEYNGAIPTRDDPEYKYTFTGWTPTIASVTGDVTYSATYSSVKKKYTITWMDMALAAPDNVIKTEEHEWHDTLSFKYQKPSDESYSYVFLGWSPEVTLVEGNATYVAQYNAIPLNMIVEDDETIPGNVEVVTTTVKVSGHLTINEGAQLTTNDLILEASGTGSGDINGADRVQLKAGGKAYFDYTFDVDPWHWSAFGVPFEIDLKAAAPLKEKSHPMTLGSDYDIVYYDSQERAAHGPSGKCWKYVENDAEHKLTPGKLYMIAFNRPVGHVNVVRFTKANSAVIDYTADVPLSTSGTGDNNNWNGIANPKMFHALLNAGVTECQVHDGGEIGKDGYHTYIMDNKKFFVGKAAFVQVPVGKSVMTTEPAMNQGAIVAKAPRRAKAQEGADRYDVQIAPMAEEMSDHVFLLTDEDKADEYVIVSDLAKAGVSPVRPQMWVNRYGVKLCKNTVAMRNNVADYPLGISVPADGSYDIFLEERPNNDDMLYLTYDGEAIWNLSYGACTIELPRGTNDHYGLRVVAKSPQVATGIEETTIQNGDAVRKVIVEDKVFIIRNGQVYSIDGRLAK